MKNKRYTISTMCFKTLEAAKEQLLKFEEDSGIAKGTRVFEVSKAYDVKVKQVVSLTASKKEWSKDGK